MTIIIFLIVLAVLIFVHELGHFLAARIFGMRVDAFKIGFGPKLFAWRKGETDYGVNAIPFGGYVKIFGEDPNAESLADASKSFVNKPRWQQAVTLAAGVLFNLIFAATLYCVVFTSGFTASPEGLEQYSNLFRNDRVIVTSVAADSPAAKAGIKEGDSIAYVETAAMNSMRDISGRAAITGQTVEDMMNVIADYRGLPVSFAYSREGSTTIAKVLPVEGLISGRAAIGIAMARAVDLKLPVGSAIKEGFVYTGIIIDNTVSGLYDLVAGAFKGHADLSEVTGPVGIYGIVGDAARMGWSYLLMITAIISINLGIINLIPFPALDGGRILFVAIESVIRRRIPHKIANITNLVGFALLMLLMVAITWRDVARLVHS